MNSIGLADPVSALVQQSAVYVWPDTSLREIAETLERESIGLVLVQREGGFAGVVSERDIVRAVAEGQDLDADRAADVMTYEIAYIDGNDSIEHVADLMLAGDMRHVAVHRTDGQVGVLSVRDVLPVLLAELAKPYI
jgi:CBS domain-containing protein